MMQEETTAAQESTMFAKIKNLSPRTKIALGVLGVPLLIAIMAFGYWTISPLFLNVQVSEALNDEGAAVLREGTFVGADTVIHKAEGTARMVRTNANEIIVRFEDDFKVSNGPDLYVWLTKDGNVKNGYADLGKLKGNIGSQNYSIPADTDLSQYTTVIIWCKAFSVLFGTAQLEQT